MNDDDLVHSPFNETQARPVEPGEYPVWDEALTLVNHDLAALLPDHGPLRLVARPTWPEESADDEQAAEHVYVAMPNGSWHGNELPPERSAGPGAALAAVAFAAQDTVLEYLWQVWPVCPEHRLGMHPGEEHGRAVWWCAGGPDGQNAQHVSAAVGEVEESYRPRRERRKRRRQNQQKNRDKQQ
ncbi:hypothetical protein ABZ725_21530 [Streptomyces sp. NPDC006872]|uniref:hypothetical protein n=1 Tax=Streptomyces sp. NPDC006872 TaxID=3155720 RepID=UPI0033C61348